jgi:ribosomal protein S18 acetylase RimI-like enzyme
LDAPKFAVIELIVDEAWRGRGIGRQLMDDLLADRTEPYAMLTTRATNPARKMYSRWGWVQVGTTQHTPTAPVMDQLVLPLR